MRSTLFTILTFLLISNAIAGNTWQTATQLPQDSSIKATQDGEAWYVVNITGNQSNKRILIDLIFSHADGNIDMDLFGDDFVVSDPTGIDPGLWRGSSTTTSDDEFIENNIPSVPGAYYIRVYGADAGKSYRLTWSELTGADDGFEPNDISADAKEIFDGDVTFGSQSDEDWYSIYVESGYRNVLASLRFYNSLPTDPNLIDLNLELSDTSGTIIASSANPSGINESVDVVVPASGTYYLRIYGDNNGDGYALDWAGVNEPPQATANTVTTTENIPYSFMASDFTFSDNEDDSLVSATLSSLSLGGGTLTHSSGTAVSDPDTLTAAQLDTLVYTPPAGSTGSPLASFDFAVNDIDNGTVAAQMSINVTEDTTTTPVSSSSSSGAVSPIWLLALMLTGLLRRKQR
jgi:hypothetical protein